MNRLFALLTLMVCSTSATAQDTVQLPLFDGSLVLHGEVGILDDQRTADSASIEVWRPVLFGTPEKPIGGRMDCKLGGVKQIFSSALFDIEQRYKDSRDRRRNAGLDDDNREFFEQGPVRRLEVTGHANNPHRHYVLTYLALRDGDTLYDLRLNCEFRHLEGPDGDTNYAAIMHSYVDIAVPIPVPAAQQQQLEQADS